jgi:glutamine amidotransferase
VIAIVDYGMANLRSVEKALQYVGGDPTITADPAIIARADKVVLPGVGAFCAAMENLNNSGLTESVTDSIDAGKPFLGICLGLQMLFSSSSEMGDTPGLGVLDGKVVRFNEPGTPAGAENLKVPHIGWNSIRPTPGSNLLNGVVEGERVYFVHSYYPVPTADVVSATATYGYDFCCAIEQDNVAAVQFHPEKSGAVGLRILRNFVCW